MIGNRRLPILRHGNNRLDNRTVSAAYGGTTTVFSGFASIASQQWASINAPLRQPHSDRAVIVLVTSDAARPADYLSFDGITLSRYDQRTGAAASIALFAGYVPDDRVGYSVTDTINPDKIRVISAAGTFANSIRVSVWLVSGLANIAPYAVGYATTGIGTVATVDVSTPVGGIVLATAVNNITAGQSWTWTGDQTVTERSDAAATNYHFTFADTLSTAVDAANTLTATAAVVSTTELSILAASFR